MYTVEFMCSVVVSCIFFCIPNDSTIQCPFHQLYSSTQQYWSHRKHVSHSTILFRNSGLCSVSPFMVFCWPHVTLLRHLQDIYLHKVCRVWSYKQSSSVSPLLFVSISKSAQQVVWQVVPAFSASKDTHCSWYHSFYPKLETSRHSGMPIVLAEVEGWVT